MRTDRQRRGVVGDRLIVLRKLQINKRARAKTAGGVSRRAAPPGQPGWFTEGFDTRDLKEAKALLAELA